MLAKLQMKLKSAPLSEFEAARERWRSVNEAHNAKIAEIHARQIGASLARNHSNDADSERCAVARALAGPFRKMAERRPEEFARRLQDLRYELEESEPELRTERDAWNAAARAESNSVAQELVPAHRAAVDDIARALERLSRAIVSECSVREEFARRAPEAQSRFLPDMRPACGPLSQWDSPSASWVRDARQKGYL